MTQLHHQNTVKTGILLVAYGSASQVGALALRGVTERAQAAFPGIPLRWAFTSTRMRSRLAKSGKKTDSVYKALCRMHFDGYTHVAVQSLHFLAGFEYTQLLEEVAQARAGGGPAVITVGPPLLNGPGGVERAAKALLAHMPLECGPPDAIVYVGHGLGAAKQERDLGHVTGCGERDIGSMREGSGDASLGSGDVHEGAGEIGPSGYEALADAVRAKDSRIFIGSLTGAPGVDAILDCLRAAQRVWLLPLLAVVGKHAEEDLAGTGPDSWRSRIEAAGFACTPVLRGAAEYEGFLGIWLSHLETALDRLKDNP